MKKRVNVRPSDSSMVDLMKETISFAGEDSHCSSVVVENLKKTVKYKSERQPKVMKQKLLCANQVTLPPYQLKFNSESITKIKVPFSILLLLLLCGIFMAQVKIIPYIPHFSSKHKVQRAFQGTPGNFSLKLRYLNVTFTNEWILGGV